MERSCFVFVVFFNFQIIIVKFHKLVVFAIAIHINSVFWVSQQLMDGP